MTTQPAKSNSSTHYWNWKPLHEPMNSKPPPKSSKSIHLTKRTSTEAWKAHNRTKKNRLRRTSQNKNNHKRSRDQFAKPERKRTVSTMKTILLTTVGNRTRWREVTMSSLSPANPQLASSYLIQSSSNSSRRLLHLSKERRASQRDQRRESQRKPQQKKISNCKINRSRMNWSKWMKKMSRFKFNRLKLITWQWISSKPHLLWMS